jgi:hypothetical protein
MTQYLISFDDGTMIFPEEELPDVVADVRAVRMEAKAASVWVYSTTRCIRCRRPKSPPPAAAPGRSSSCYPLRPTEKSAIRQPVADGAIAVHSAAE